VTAVLQSAPGSPGDLPLSSDTEGQTAALVELLSSLHRLLKVARMYDKHNQALTASAESVIAANAEYCRSASASFADLMFANDTVFVNGQMLQMGREVYGRVMELGGMLERCDISNVNLARETTVDDLVAFVHTLGRALRDPTLKAELAGSGFGGIRARKVRWRAAFEGEKGRSPVSGVLRTYASAVVLVRRFYSDFAGGKRKLPLALRRLAQRLVTHAEEEAPLLVALAAGRQQGTDEAAVAVSSALVALLMVRQLTSDRGALSDVVLAALLHDVGRRRLLAARGDGSIASPLERPLSEEEQPRLPASDAVAAIELERLGELAIPHLVVSFEAHWQAQAARLGALYGGRRPASVLARALRVARSFCQLMTPGPYASAMGPEDALHFLEGRAADDTERLYLKLLTGGLGIFPPGTSVELSTGEIGVVLSVPEHSVDFARPPVRVMYDATGNVLSDPYDLDLATTAGGSRAPRFIRRALDTDAQQTQAMRAFVLSITSGNTSKRQRHAAQADPESGLRPAPVKQAPLPPVRAAAFEEMTLPRAPEHLGTAPLTGPENVPAAAPVATIPGAPASQPASSGRDTTASRERSRAYREAAPRLFDPRAEEDSSSQRPVEEPTFSRRPRTQPGALPPVDVVPAAARARTHPSVSSPAEVVPPAARSRTNPGALPPADVVPPAARSRTNPGALPPADVVPPAARSRTNPAALPPVDIVALPPRARTNPGASPGVDLRAASERPRTLPAQQAPADAPRSGADPLPPVDVITFSSRPRTNPGPLSPSPLEGPQGPRRARTGSGGLRDEPAPSRDSRSEPDGPVPSGPPPSSSKLVGDEARRLSRRAREIFAEATPRPAGGGVAPRVARPLLSRTDDEPAPVAPPGPTGKVDQAAPAPPVAARPVTGGSAKHSAPTVARAWGEFALEAEAAAVVIATKKTEPALAATSAPVRRDRERTVFIDDPGDSGPELDSAPPGATIKANWGGYGKVVAASTPDEKGAARQTRKIPATKAGEDPGNDPEGET